MTKDKILQMELSPEMDRLIAEKVMGWEAWRDSVPHHWARKERGVMVPMEELRRRGYDVSIEKEGLTWTIELQGEDYYSVASSEGSTGMIQLHHHQGPRYVALGKSFQEAICRVALLAAMDADEG